MKKTLSIAALIIAIIACLPLVSGLIAKNRFEALTAELQAKNPNVQIQSQYHLGWLSSTAKLTWGTSAPEAQWPAIQHEVIIHHGPLAFFYDEQGKMHFFFGIAVLDVRLPEFAKSSLFTIDFQKKIFSALVRIPFNLHYAVDVHAALQATINLASKPILNLNLDQLQLTCDFTHDFSRVKGQLLVQNFNVNADSRGYLNIPSIQVEINNHREQRVYLGNETITIPSIDLSIPPMLQFKLQDFNSAFVGLRKKNDVSYQMTLEINNANYDNQSYGPLGFNFQVNNLNFKVLAEIEEKVRVYAKQRATQPENTEDLQNALAEDLKKLLPGLVQNNTEIALKQLDLSVPSGNLHSQGSVRFVQLPTSVDNLSALMQDIELSYHLELSKSLAQSFLVDLIDSNIGIANNNIDPTSILGQLAKLGLLRENSDSYNVDINIKKGAPYVNQQPFNPSILQQLQTVAAPQEVLTPPPAGAIPPATIATPQAAVAAPQAAVTAPQAAVAAPQAAVAAPQAVVGTPAKQ